MSIGCASALKWMVTISSMISSFFSGIHRSNVDIVLLVLNNIANIFIDLLPELVLRQELYSFLISSQIPSTSLMWVSTLEYVQNWFLTYRFVYTHSPTQEFRVRVSTKNKSFQRFVIRNYINFAAKNIMKYFVIHAVANNSFSITE